MALGKEEMRYMVGLQEGRMGSRKEGIKGEKKEGRKEGKRTG